MKIYLIRHGETTANVEKRFAGVLDVSLTEKGVGQAVLAGEKLKNIPFDAIYASDLVRASETARLIATHQNAETVILPALREMNFGVWEGLKMTEIKEKDGEKLNQWFVDFDHFIVPEGESVKEMFERVTDAYNKIIAPYSKDDDVKIAIVAHGGVIQALMSFLCFGDNTGYWKFRIENCGIAIVEYVMGYPVIRALNQ